MFQMIPHGVTGTQASRITKNKENRAVVSIFQSRLLNGQKLFGPFYVQLNYPGPGMLRPENGTYKTHVKCFKHTKIKISESQPGARNQEFQSFNVNENFENIENDPLNMMNNFCFHVYDQKSLFRGKKCQWFIFYSILLCEF